MAAFAGPNPPPSTGESRANLVPRSECRRKSLVKQELLAGVRAHLGPDYDLATHFTPRYRPWRQRIAFVPDGDFLEAIRGGQASVVTDEIESFTETGILLRSGRVLPADIIITATGFNLNVLGDIGFSIDGKRLVFPTRSPIAA